MSSCHFLDREPLDKVGPEDYYLTADQLRSVTASYYPSIFTYHPRSFSAGVARFDNGTDNQAGPSPNYNMFTGDRWKVATQGGIGFEGIRDINAFIRIVEEKMPSEDQLRTADAQHYLGEAYFIRAALYFEKLMEYGDYPIVLVDLPNDNERLIAESKRMPRNEVARQILKDLDKAYELVKQNTPLKQYISKPVVQLYRSRVALYEATFERYHRGSGRVPGDAEWPGKDKEWNRGKTFDQESEVNFFLDEAMRAAKAVGESITLQTQNTHKLYPEEGDPTNGWNPYYDIFASRDLTPYPEVLMWKQYSKSLNHTHNTSHYLDRGAGTGYTRSLVSSFLMKSGLPTYADPSNYKGERKLSDVVENRDERLGLFVFTEKTTQTLVPFKKFSQPNFFGNEEIRDVTGYRPRKFYNYDPSENPNAEMNAWSGFPIFRVAEAYLNYIEASYERNHTLDATARKYWQALRRRAGVNDDLDNTIAHTDMSIEADLNRTDYDWGAFSAGQAVDATLYNIRRERRCEFIAEGKRMHDLIRWRAMDQVRNYQIEGCDFWDTWGRVQLVNTETNEEITIKADGSDKANVSAESLSKYLRPYQIVKANNEMWDGYTFYQAHYLSPFSALEIQLASPDGSVENSNLYQNPGWPSQGGQPALQ